LDFHLEPKVIIQFNKLILRLIFGLELVKLLTVTLQYAILSFGGDFLAKIIYGIIYGLQIAILWFWVVYSLPYHKPMDNYTSSWAFGLTLGVVIYRVLPEFLGLTDSPRFLFFAAALLLSVAGMLVVKFRYVTMYDRMDETASDPSKLQEGSVSDIEAEVIPLTYFFHFEDEENSFIFGTYNSRD
jgi:hypothetical protein